MRFLRRHFLTGLVVIAPTAITAYVVWWGFTKIDNLIEPLQKRYPIIDIPGIGFAIVLVLIVITGILASNLIGKRVISLGEGLMNRVPFVRRIYSAVKEVASVLISEKTTAFQRVVLIRYPHRDAYALAFVTKDGIDYINRAVDSELVNVFIPTTPNPTSGFFLMLPKCDVIELDIPVEEAMKMVISGGAFAPDLSKPARIPNKKRIQSRTP
jgi:uncharacterized membrane protein